MIIFRRRSTSHVMTELIGWRANSLLDCILLRLCRALNQGDAAASSSAATQKNSLTSLALPHSQLRCCLGGERASHAIHCRQPLRAAFRQPLPLRDGQKLGELLLLVNGVEKFKPAGKTHWLARTRAC